MLNKKDQRLRRSRQTRLRIARQVAVRLTVFRSNLHVYASVISDDGSKILASASTAEKAVRDQLGGAGKGGTAAAAAIVGKRIAEKAKAAGSTRWPSTARVLPFTAASGHWPKPRVKPAFSSERDDE